MRVIQFYETATSNKYVTRVQSCPLTYLHVSYQPSILSELVGMSQLQSYEPNLAHIKGIRSDHHTLRYQPGIRIRLDT